MSTFDELFADRRWRVLTEASGTMTADPVKGIKVSFKRGHFTIAGGEPDYCGVFQSPLSANKGRGGVLLQEIRDGQDVPGSVIPVGEKSLPRVREAGALV